MDIERLGGCFGQPRRGVVSGGQALPLQMLGKSLQLVEASEYAPQPRPDHIKDLQCFQSITDAN